MEKVLVTGCSSGFGLDIATTLAGCGYEVIATVRASSDLTALNSRIQNRHLEKMMHIEYLDLMEVFSNPSKVVSLNEKYDGFDMIVLNAGILYAGLCEQLSVERINQMVQTNLTANMVLVSLLVSKMKERRKGKLIFVSSLAALRPLPFLSSYNASKAGLSAYAKSLYLELALYDISVHLVEPSFYKTELWNHEMNCQDDYSKRLKKISLSNTEKREVKEVTFQVLKICQGRKKGLHSVFGVYSLLQVLFSSLLYTKLGKRVYRWVISK